MPLDPRIALGVEPPKFNAPFEMLGQLQQLQQQQQVIRSNQALEESRRQDIEKQRKLEAAQQKYYAIISTSKTPDDVEARIRVEAPELLAGYQKQRLELDEKAATIKEKGLQASKLVAEIQKQGKEYAEPFMQLVEKSGHKPEVFDFALNTIQAHFPDFPADQYRQQAGGDPGKIKAIVDSLKSPQQQTTDLAAQQQAVTLPGQQADTAVKQQVAAGTVGGLTPDQQRQAAQAAAAATAAADARRTQEGFERQRLGLEGQRIGLERQRVAQAQGDTTDLTPAGLDAAAMMFGKTGQLPALGMGDRTTRKLIINRAAELIPGLDVASAKADFTANQDSLKAMQKQRDAISAFEQTAAKNIDIFLETAGKVVDTGSPFLNTPARIVTGKMLGSADQAKYDAARQVAINEVAKITSNPSMAGQLSDTARKEVEAFNPQNATLKQSVEVMRLLKRDMANRASSMDDQIEAIKGRLKKADSVAPTAAAAPTASGEMTIQHIKTGKKARGPRGPVPAGWQEVP